MLAGKRGSIMPLYLDELAPWERKNEYYHIIQLGKDVGEQTHTINKQTRAMIASQIASTNAIIASQDRICEGIDSMAYGVERVEEGIYELKSAFEWGISEVVWQIEQNREVLKSILEVLMAPLDTQAKERRKRAEEAFANGWIDDAEEEFLESEQLNKFDFSIHISLGIIYLFSKIDKMKALSYFEKAIKYAKPKSAYHTSYALLYKSLIKFDFGEVKDAEKFTTEAIGLSPDFAEALYQNAQYNAQLMNIDKSISNLEKAIKKDKYYCLKAHKDPLFDPIRAQVNQLFEKLRGDEKEKTLKSYDSLSTKHDKLDPIFLDISHERFTDISAFFEEIDEIDKQLSELRERISRDSYYDFLDINYIFVPKLQKNQERLLSDLKQKFRSIVDSCESGIKNAESKHKNKIQEYLGKTGSAILYGSFIVPAIMSLIALEGWNKLAFIIFCIPILSQIISLAFLGCLIFAYSKFGKGELVLAWSIVIYLVASACYFFISKATSKEEMSSEIRKQNLVLQKAVPFLEKLKSL